MYACGVAYNGKDGVDVVGGEDDDYDALDDHILISFPHLLTGINK